MILLIHSVPSLTVPLTSTGSFFLRTFSAWIGSLAWTRSPALLVAVRLFAATAPHLSCRLCLLQTLPFLLTLTAS